MPSSPRFMPRPLLRAALVAAAALAASPSFALYKVVGPDGKVTYTDRPPATSSGRISPLNTRAGTGQSVDALPAELRQAASRYPVTLYTLSGDCGPCVEARDLLRKRGVPYSERQVTTAEDSAAFQKLTGGTDAPVLAIGSQQLKGLAPDTWNGYLDAAGYPKESKLPPGYAFASPQPLTERQSSAPAQPAQPARQEPAETEATPPPAGSFRF